MTNAPFYPAKKPPWDPRFIISKKEGRGKRTKYIVLYSHDRSLAFGPARWKTCRDWIEEQKEKVKPTEDKGDG